MIRLTGTSPVSGGGPPAQHAFVGLPLCAFEPSYLDVLSAASVHSLGKQGGPMSGAEVAEFARRPHAEAAVRLLRWDDGGKVDGLVVRQVADYRDRILKVARAG